MTRPIDKDCILRSCDVLTALAPVLTAGLFVVFVLAPGIIPWMLVVGAIVFCLVALLAALTAPLWGAALGLAWLAVAALLAPLYHLWGKVSRAYKASRSQS